MLSQRSSTQLTKIEFGSISKGLEKPTQSIVQTEEGQQVVLPEKAKLKLMNQRLQTLSNDIPLQTDLSTAEGQLVDENRNHQKQLKFDKLRRQPPTFFEKIPKDPLTLMNSTRRNKQIQINILANSKQAVKQHIINNQSQQSPAQDAAVRELLDNFQTQFNFRTAIDAKKKRQVEDLKAKYLKTFFIKNIPTKEKIVYKYYDPSKSRGYTNRDDRMKLKSESTQPQFTQSFQTQIHTDNCCGGYCQYLKEIYLKKQRSHKHLSDLTASN